MNGHRRRRSVRIRGVRLESLCPWIMAVVAAASSPGVAAQGPVAGERPDSERGNASAIYENVSLLDGTGAPLQTGMAIVVRDARIVDVVPVEALSDADRDGADVVDADGLFVIPGLIEAHAHLATLADRERAEFYLNRYLYGGITTVRDMAGDVRSLMDLQRAALVGEIDAPDVNFSALVAGPSFFSDPRTVSSAMGEVPGRVSWMQSVQDSTDLRELVALARGTWATGLKTYAAIEGPLLARISGEARFQEIPVWAHSHIGPARPMEVALAGVTSMSHACGLASAAIPDDVFEDGQAGRRTGFVDVDLESPAIDAVLRSMKEHRTVLDATLRLYVEQERSQERTAPPPPPAPEREEERPVVDRRLRGVRARCSADDAVALVRRAFAANVLISAGTDGGAPPDSEWPALHEELALLNQRVGMPMDSVIVAATRNGAIALGLEDQIGTIAPGKLANMLFLREDPRSNVESLRSVEFTLKRGARYDRSDFDLGVLKDRAG